MHFEKANGFEQWVEILLEVDKSKANLENVLKRDTVSAFFDSIMIVRES